MRGGALDVRAYAPGYVLRLLLSHLSYPPGRSTDYEATWRELVSFGDEGAGGHDRAFAYLCSVEDRGAHPDETTVPDLAPVHDRFVAYDAPLAHYRRVPWIRVQHATVLDVRARPYTDRLRVSPQNGPVPHARLLPQVHRPDDVGPRRDESGSGNLRLSIPEGEQVSDKLHLYRHGTVPSPAASVPEDLRPFQACSSTARTCRHQFIGRRRV